MKNFFTSLFLAVVCVSASGINPVTPIASNSWTKVFNDPFVATNEDESANLAFIAKNPKGGYYLTSLINEEKVGIKGNEIAAIAGGSTYVAKYDENGQLVWDTSIYGAATPTAIAADDDGNLYVAGTFADAIRIDGVDGIQTMLTGITGGTKQVTSFIAKFNSLGNYVASKLFIPTTHPDLVGNDMYWGSEGDVYLRINSLSVWGTKLAFSAEYTGQTCFDGLTLTASYYNAFGFYPGDVAASAVLTVDFNLSSSSLLFQAVGVSGDGINYPATGCKLAVYDGRLYSNLHLTGKTKLTYQDKSTEDVNLQVDEVSLDGETYYSGLEVGYLTTSFSSNGSKEKSALYTLKGIDPYSLNDQLSAGITANSTGIYVAARYNGKNPYDNNESAHFAVSVKHLNIADMSENTVYNLSSASDIQSIYMASGVNNMALYASSDSVINFNGEAIALSKNEKALILMNNGNKSYMVISSGAKVSSLVMNDEAVAYCGNVPLATTQVQKEFAQMAYKLESGTGIVAPAELSVRVYPNPTTDYICFSLPLSGAVYALDGRPVVSFPVSSQIDVRHLTAGSYILKGATADGTMLVQTIIKQ